MSDEKTEFHSVVFPIAATDLWYVFKRWGATGWVAYPSPGTARRLSPGSTIIHVPAGRRSGIPWKGEES